LPKKNYAVQDRRRARQLAVQLLYSLDARPEQNISDCLDAFAFEEDGFASLENAQVKEYLRFLVEGVWRKRRDIDNKMRMVLTGWRPERMVAVDRAVLRVAIFEGFLENKVPAPVAISEAVEVARFFGTEESGKFVNGVLGKVARLAQGVQAAKEAQEGKGAIGENGSVNPNQISPLQENNESNEKHENNDNRDDDHAASASPLPVDR
jgi:N utilization substance protein B